MSKRLLNIPVTAERLGVQPSTVRFWVWQRKIEFVKVGRAVRIPEAVVERMIEAGTVPAQRRAEASR